MRFLDYLQRFWLVFAFTGLISTSSMAQLSGVKTIDPAGSGANNYPSFTAAFKALNNLGVGPGGVTFNVSSGVFNELPPVLTATGTASAPITFRKAGTGANPVIKPHMAGIYSNTAALTFQDGIIRISAGDYITFDGIDLQDSGRFPNDVYRYEFGYFLMRTATDAPQHIVIKNCRISLDPAIKTSIGIFQSTFNALGTDFLPTSQSGVCDSNYYLNNTITAKLGIALRGPGGPFYDGYMAVERNTINFGGTTGTVYSIYGLYNQYFQIKDNVLTCDSAQVGTVVGISVTSPNNIAINSLSEIQYNRMVITASSVNSGVTGYNFNTGVSSAAPGIVSKIHHNTFKASMPKSTVAPLYGFQISGYAGSNEVYSNSVDSVYHVGTGLVYAFNMNAQMSNSVHHNIVRGLHTTISSSVIGLSLYASVNGYAYNNVVSEMYTDSNTTDAFRGIFVITGSWKVYNNTVYLDAQSKAANFSPVGLYVSSTCDAELVNNIIVNKSIAGVTGSAVAYKRSAISFSRMLERSDRNIYYVNPGANNFIYQDNVYKLASLRDYKLLLGGIFPREQFSATEDVPFINTATHPYDLNISTTIATQVESIGMPNAVVTDDVKGNIRNTGHPDAGAYEGNYTGAETTPPSIFVPQINSTVKTSLTVNGVQITDLTGVNVGTGKPRLYYRKRTDINTYAGNTSADNGWKYVETTSSATPFSFTIDYTKLYGGSIAAGDTIEYFVIAQDLVATPNVDFNKGTMASIPASVALTASNFPLTGTVNYFVVKPAISGVINVGAGETYTSLTGTTGLFNAVNNSVVSGNIEVHITSDLAETGAVALNEFISESPAYGLSIMPSAAVKYTIRGKYKGGLIRFDRAKNVIVDGRFGGSGNYLEFLNDSASAYTAAFHIIGTSPAGALVPNGCKNVTIRNTTIIGPGRKIIDSYGIFVGNTTVSTTSGIKNSGIHILSNNIMRCYSGMVLRGDVTTGNYSDSFEIANNNIGSYDSAYYNGCYGIYLYSIVNSRIQGNKVFNIYYDIPTQVTPIGININLGCENNLFSGNKVFNIVSNSTASCGSVGIVLNSCKTQTLYNNVVYGVKSATQSVMSNYGVFGIYIIGSSGHKVYYNTVNLSDSMGTNPLVPSYSAALAVLTVTNIDLDIRNNIFANSIKQAGVGSRAFGAWFVNTFDFSSSTLDYNAYFVPSQGTATTSYYTGFDGTINYPTRNDWRAFSKQDRHSQPPVNQLAGFVNDSTLAVQDGIISPAESTGIEIAALGTPNVDFNGNARPKGTGVAPDLGAFEFEGIRGDFQDPEIDSVRIDLTGNQCEPVARVVSAYFTDPGASGVDSAWITYLIDGVAQPKVPMTFTSGTAVKGMWKGTILAAPTRGQMISYSISARDIAGNTSQVISGVSYKDGYLVTDAGLPVTINENTRARLIATKNQAGTITWTPGGFTGDTLVTPALPATTRFYATLSDGICATVDSVNVTVVTPVPPVAAFGISESYVLPLTPVQLTDSSTHIPDHWKWTITPSTYAFRNGTTDSSINPALVFIQPGKYTIQLRVENAAGADSLLKTDVVEVYKEYWEPTSGGDGLRRDNITRVKLNTLYHVDTTYRQFENYVNYSVLDSNETTTLTKGKTYTVSAFNGGTRMASIAAWIDYNGNGTFEDAGEKLGETVNVVVNDSAMLTFTVPTDFVEGYTRLRLRLVFGAYDLASYGNYGNEEMLDFRLGLCNIYENPILVSQASFCPGEAFIADAQNPGMTYNWSNGKTDQSVALKETGTYIVTISDDFCSVKDSIDIYVKPGLAGAMLVPDAAFGGEPGDGGLIPDTVCSGGTLQFEILPPVAYGNNSFMSKWVYFNEPVTTESGALFKGNMQFVPPSISGNGRITFSPALSDEDSIYRVSLHLVNTLSGCDSLLVRYIKVSPGMAVSLGNDTTICAGESVTLDAGVFSDYSWSTGEHTQTIVVNQPGKYEVTATTLNGCSSTGAIQLNVAALPVINLGKDTTLCHGDSLVLDAGTFASYSWSTGETSRSIKANGAGAYSVTVTNSNGCSTADTIKVMVHPALNADFTYTTNVGGKGGNISFTAITTSGVSYLWEFGNQFMTVAQSPVYQYTSNGTFPVVLTITDVVTGCSASLSKQIQINNLSVTDPAVVDQKVQVYPNPYVNSTMLKYELAEAAQVEITVYDLTGRVVEQVARGKQAPGQYQYVLHGGTDAGVYLVKVRVNKAISTIRIVKGE